jgi:signal transduction histidine kinase
MRLSRPIDYNASMKIMTSRSDARRLIRLAAFLLIGYVIVLAFISLVFQPSQPPQPPQPPPMQPSGQNADYIYYILYGCTALLCLIMAYWPWLERKLKQAFMPIVIAVLTVSPILINQFVGRSFPLGPRFGSPEATFLVMFPFLFVALLLVAWQYKWQHTLLVILGVTALNLGLRWSSIRPAVSEPSFFMAPGGSNGYIFINTQPFQGVLAVFLIQTVIFLVVGFSISYLVNRLRAQQESLEAANSRLTRYASTLEQLATSRERNRLALELHDTLAHTLSGLSVQLETIKAYWSVDEPAARSILDKSLAATHSGLEETRRALKALRASPLEDLGLALSIRKMAEDAVSRAGLVLDTPEIKDVTILPPDIEQGIYRVAQEAVTNVVKHASAKKLKLSLEFDEQAVHLVISDDGVGFDIDKIDKTNHFGLTGMQDRAELIGGELNVTSKPGFGTIIHLTVKR